LLTRASKENAQHPPLRKGLRPAVIQKSPYFGKKNHKFSGIRNYFLQKKKAVIIG